MENSEVLIQGLPVTYTEYSIGGFIHEQIARDERGNLKILLFPPGPQYRSARVSFIDAATARRFIKTQDNRPPPGEKNRLSVKAYEDKGKKQNGRVVDATPLVVDRYSVHISGLPENVQENELLRFFSSRNTIIAVYPKGGNKIHVLKRENGKAVAKITFTEPAGAARCVEQNNGLLFRGMANYKMWIKEFKAKEIPPATKSEPIVIEKHSDKPKTIVRNVVYVQGLSKDADEGQIINVFEICGKVKRVRLYKYDNGKSQGRGVISFENYATSQRCIQLFNGRRYPGLQTTTMAISLFESTKIKRLPGAVGNDDLFVNNAPAHAYDCIVCFDTWDERDMIGCVPVGHQADAETHYVCQECARNHAKSLTTQGEVGTGGAGLPCGAERCRRVIMWGTIKKSLDAKTINLLDKRLTARALHGVKIDGRDEIEFCKYCDFGYVPAQNKVQLQFFSCLTPKCKAQFCRSCLVDFAKHSGKSCDDVDPVKQQERARTAYEEALSAAVIRICPSCNSQFQKLDGCNKMVCQTCKTTMCYLCRATGIGYDHFHTGACQTHANSDEYDRNQLAKVREQARMNQLTRELVERI